MFLEIAFWDLPLERGMALFYSLLLGNGNLFLEHFHTDLELPELPVQADPVPENSVPPPDRHDDKLAREGLMGKERPVEKTRDQKLQLLRARLHFFLLFPFFLPVSSPG